MNAVLQQLERDGQIPLPDGSRIQVHSGVGPESGRVLRRAIQVAAPQVGCEVGLAFGVSTLHILQAMADFGGGRLIGMDPAQQDATWQGAGLWNLERAGLRDRYAFHERPSQVVLPQLAEQGLRIQFAFIDGWHTFDHTLVDFFYLDRMMDVGGVMVLDDVGYPGLQRLAHFIVTNRAYEVLDSAARTVPTGWRVAAKRWAQRAFAPVVRDNHTPSSASAALKARVDTAQLVALRKVADDDRRFDHFVPF